MIGAPSVNSALAPLKVTVTIELARALLESETASCEPGSLAVARGRPEVYEVIANGELLYGAAADADPR